MQAYQILGGVHLLATALASATPTADVPNPHRSVMAAQQALANPTSSHIVTIAHRACWEIAPENSLAAVEHCVRIGVDAVETDIRHTRDGVAIIMHDETVDRTTNGTGRVADLSWAEIAKLRLRARAGGIGVELTNERVPTLDAFIASAKDRLLVVYDVKDGSQVSTLARIKDAKAEDQAIFFYECVDQTLANAIAPFRDEVITIPIMFGRDGPLADTLGRCRSNPPGWAHVKWSDATWLDQVASGQRLAPVRLWTATMFPADNAGMDDARALIEPDLGSVPAEGEMTP